jgi:deazaflavin-dependent oxidoreductase (nitroreductase family)
MPIEPSLPQTYGGAVSNPAKDLVAKGLNVVHRTLFEITNGKIGGRAGGMPAVKLETTGRKSGQRRTVMLTSPVQPEGDIALVASYGGDEKHPAWYLNLQADPNVTITMDGRTFDATARTATPEEKAELWPQITSEYKGYAGYQKRTDRDIPVVICTPVG